MTAKELLLQEAPTWSEEQAERALNAVHTKAVSNVDVWGDLDAWSDAASKDTMHMLDEEEAAAGFSWDDTGPS
jgi:hypothetical protein